MCVCACKETNSSNYNHPSYYRMNAVLENLLLPVESFGGFSFALNHFIAFSFFPPLQHLFHYCVCVMNSKQMNHPLSTIF